jgi:hypothetical protein
VLASELGQKTSYPDWDPFHSAFPSDNSTRRLLATRAPATCFVSDCSISCNYKVFSKSYPSLCCSVSLVVLFCASHCIVLCSHCVVLCLSLCCSVPLVVLFCVSRCVVLCLSLYCFVFSLYCSVFSLCCSVSLNVLFCVFIEFFMYCLCVNVYCTTATGISWHLSTTLNKGFSVLFPQL